MYIKDGILSEYEKGFLEAAIDFEGTLSVRRLKSNKYSHGYSIDPAGLISNTNVQLLEKVKFIIGAGRIGIHQRYDSNKNYKPAYNYRFPRHVLRAILPQLNLVEKEIQKKLVLEALNIINHNQHFHGGNSMPDDMYNRLEEIVFEVRTYNSRGLNSNWNKDRLLNQIEKYRTLDGRT